MADRPERSIKEPEEAEAQPIFTLADAKAGDLRVAQKHPMQDFVDGFGRLGKLYNDSVQDNGRFAKFQERMGNLYVNDRATFNELAKVGDGITAQPPAAPAETGKALGEALANALVRRSQAGTVDLGSAENLQLLGSVAGMMLAARANFSAATMDAQTREMVDALDAKLRERGAPHLYGVMYGDNGEPGVAVVPPGQAFDRHKF